VKKRFRAPALGALLLAAVLLLECPVLAGGRYPEKEHLPVDFADMVYTGFDSTALQNALSALRQIAATPAIRTEDAETRAELQSLYNQILAETDNLSTQSALIGIRYDANGADEEAAAESAALSDLATQASDDCYRALRLLVGTPYQDIVERDAGAGGIAFLQNYREMTEREAELCREEERLVQDYDRVMARPAQVTVDGRVWTEDALERDTELDDEGYWKIRTLLEQAENRAAGEIFCRLVQVRTEIAACNGYDDYAAYAYREVYGRDYAAGDIRSVYQAAKDHWVSLESQLQDMVSARDLRTLDIRSRAAGDEILDAIQPYMERIDPELAETFAFMRQYHLCDIAPSESKLPTGYTVGLPVYGTAFIFDCPYGDHQDYSTAIHEFGHFNETFHSVEKELWSEFYIDVGEIHSQGLEVLFAAYAEELFGATGGRAFYWSTISNMVSSVLEGCMYDEFQTAVYQNPQMTLEEINRLFREISEEYGYFYEDGQEESYFWVEIPHTFQNPMYYISYATSALSALDLWLLSLEDRDRAVETYLELAVMGMSHPYRESVASAGLRDIFRAGVMRELAKGVQNSLPAVLNGEEPPGDGGLPLWAQALGGGAAVLVAAGVLLAVWRRRQAAEAVEPFL